MGVLFGSRKSFRPSPAELPEALKRLSNYRFGDAAPRWSAE
jgi:hypothetical protein